MFTKPRSARPTFGADEYVDSSYLPTATEVQTDNLSLYGGQGTGAGYNSTSTLLNYYAPVASVPKTGSAQPAPISAGSLLSSFTSGFASARPVMTAAPLAAQPASSSSSYLLVGAAVLAAILVFKMKG